MKYIIEDHQTGSEFAGGALFDSVIEAVDQLIDYHSIDCCDGEYPGDGTYVHSADGCSVGEAQRLLDAGDVEGAKNEIYEHGQGWEIREATEEEIAELGE